MPAVILDEIKNLKIVPENYESATAFVIKEINNGIVKIDLTKATDSDLESYKVNETIEAFGLAGHGLVYFTSQIIEKNNKELSIKYPEKIQEIQRRKYTRVPFDGNIIVDKQKEVQIKTVDISAGGLKFIADTPFMVGDEYEIKVELPNNLFIDCSMQPIRVEENDDHEDKLIYSISAKFKRIRSIDRITLMQYSLRLVSELENKT